MQRRNCCKRRTAWKKRRRGTESRSEKRGRAGSFRRVRFWKRCCQRFKLLSCLSWRGIFHGNWENKSKFQIGGLREAGGLLLFSPVRAHLLTTQKGRWYCLRQPCALRGGCGSCGSLMSNATSHLCCCHWPRSRLYVLLHHQNCCFRFGNNPPPARIKLPPAALFAVMGIACRNTHFLFAKKKQKQGRKDGENEWRFTT